MTDNALAVAVLAALLRMSRTGLPPRRPTLAGVVARVVAGSSCETDPREVRRVLARLERAGLVYMPPRSNDVRLTLTGLAVASS